MKAGRKRKIARREPNGRAVREKDLPPLALVKRQQAVGASGAKSQEAGSLIGCWLLQGKITRDQYEAAEGYYRARAQWRKLVEAPPEPHCFNLAVSAGQKSQELWDPVLEAKRAVRLRRAYISRWNVILRQRLPVISAVNAALADDPVASVELAAIGFQALVDENLKGW